MVFPLHPLEGRGMMNIVDRIKTLCGHQELTIAELERKLDFGNGTIRRWTTAAPSADKLLKISDFFHVSVDYLLGNVMPDAPRIQIVSRDESKMTKEDLEKIQNILGAVFDGKYYVQSIEDERQ